MTEIEAKGHCSYTPGRLEGLSLRLSYLTHVSLLVLHPQAPEGENQPSTEVDLFISTEKIMVLNTDLKVSARKLHINIFCIASFYPRGCVNPDPAISPNLLEKNMHVRRIHRIVNLLCITYFGLAILVPLSLSQKVSAATSVSPSFLLHNLRAEWVCH